MIQTINNAIAKRRASLENGESEKGFTLIELIVVIIIIGILAAIAIPAFLNQRINAWDASVKSDLGNAAIATASYSVQYNGSYTGTVPLTIVLLTGTYGLKITSGNALTLGAVTATSYVITGKNANSPNTYTLTTGNITGP
jgi:type IV pilus assembly protein PilA